MEEFIKFASTVLGLNESEVAALVKDGDKIKSDAVSVLLEKHKTKVASDSEDVKKKADEKADNFYKKGQKEVHDLYMAGLAKVGIDKTLPADKALEALESKLNAKGDEAEIMKHPAVIKLEVKIREEMTKKNEEELKKVTDDFTSYKTKVEGDKVTGNIRQKFEDEVAKLTLMDGLPAETIKLLKDSTFNQFLASTKFKDVDGVLMVVDDEGKLKKDAHGNLIKIESLLVDATKALPIKPGTTRKTFGQDDPGADGKDKGEYKGELKMPKNMAEFSSMGAEYASLMRAGKLKKEDFAAWNDAAPKAIEEASKPAA